MLFKIFNITYDLKTNQNKKIFNTYVIQIVDIDSSKIGDSLCKNNKNLKIELLTLTLDLLVTKYMYGSRLVEM